MKVYFKNSAKESDKRAYGLYNYWNALAYRQTHAGDLSEIEIKRLSKLGRVFSAYDRHIPVTTEIINQWENELGYHSGSYAEIFKGMIKLAKYCNKMQSEAISKIKAC